MKLDMSISSNADEEEEYEHSQGQQEFDVQRWSQWTKHPSVRFMRRPEEDARGRGIGDDCVQTQAAEYPLEQLGGTMIRTRRGPITIVGVRWNFRATLNNSAMSRNGKCSTSILVASKRDEGNSKRAGRSSICMFRKSYVTDT